MIWQGDPFDYLTRLQEWLFPGDWELQNNLLWAVYGGDIDLTSDTERDLPAVRAFMANQALHRSCAAVELSDTHLKKISRISQCPG